MPGNDSKGMPTPSIEECLFGPSRKCPSLSDKPPGPSLGSFLEDGGRPSNDSSSTGYDSIAAGRWGDAATTKHDIDMQLLRRIASQGVADEGSHRAVAWRVLLGCLPNKNIAETWKKSLPEQRALYESQVAKYFDGKREQGKDLRGYHSRKLKNQKLRKKFHKVERLDYDSADDGETEKELQKLGVLDEDDNASLLSEPTVDTFSQPTTNQGTILDRLPQKFKEQWKKSGIDIDSNKNLASQGTSVALGINQLKIPEFEDNDEEKFTEFLESARLLEEIRKDVVRTHPDLYFFLEPERNLGSRRYAAIERILFIWASLNKKVRYVQGMNEIVGTVYYVLANDVNGEWATQAEADSYFLFNTLMVEMRDVFVPAMDEADTGIQGRISNMQTLLSTHDPALQEHLQECGIDSSFYAIRWLTTLLSREFLLPDTIRLWDSMFASTHKENFLRYVCGTMVLMIREELLKGDFSSCLRLLQRYPPANVDKLLESSRSLWIYESQITMACHKGGISLHQALSTISPPPAIIMAFGLRGGVGPRRSSIDRRRANEAAVQVRNEDGLLGRAMKLWSGWGTPMGVTTSSPTMTSPSNKSVPGDSTHAETNTTGQSVQTAQPQPRSWNRGRSNTGDTNDSTASNGDVTGIASVGESMFRSRLWGRFGASAQSGTNAPGSTIAGTPTINESTSLAGTTPRSRLWNRATRNNTPPRNGATAATTNGEESNSGRWTPPPGTRAWNRNAQKQDQPGPFGSTTSTTVDPMLPPTANRRHMSDVMEILSS